MSTTVLARSISAALPGASLVASFSVAAALPTLLAYNLPPSPTALNQAAAIGAWGLAMLLLAAQARGQHAQHPALSAAWAPMAALAFISASAFLSWVWAGLPMELSLSAAAVAVIAGMVMAAGAAMRPSASLWTSLFTAMLVAGVASLLVGLVQVFAPDATGTEWIARTGIAGRAVGNLRQPNHLSTLLLWSAVAVVPLLETQALRRHAAARIALCALFAAMLPITLP